MSDNQNLSLNQNLKQNLNLNLNLNLNQNLKLNPNLPQKRMKPLPSAEASAVARRKSKVP